MTKDENVGQIFGIYTILDIAPERHTDGHILYVCECNVCKTKESKRLSDIKRFNKQCLHTRYSWNNKRIECIFNSMVARCYNPKCKDYKWYGEKGVRICDEWINNPESFELWSVNNGYTDSMTIDRKDSDDCYCPENCQWVSREENSRKAGNVNWIVVGEHALTGHQWADKFGLGTNRINILIRKYGLDKVKELIAAMLQEPPINKERKLNQSWFDVYDIQI